MFPATAPVSIWAREIAGFRIANPRTAIRSRKQKSLPGTRCLRVEISFLNIGAFMRSNSLLAFR
jgi:hypothetical protein